MAESDIIFLQETNGSFTSLLQLIRQCPGWGQALGDSANGIILRSGTFLDVNEQWPHAFYCKVRVKGRKLLLVNVHLCEHAWLTTNEHTEEHYRGRYLRRMVAHLERVAFGERIILAGDFNSVRIDDILVKEGYTDTCTSYSNYTWPVPLTHLPESRFLREQSIGTRARIDRIYVKGNLSPVRSEIVHWNRGWFSDHSAVTSILEVRGKKEYGLQLSQEEHTPLYLKLQLTPTGDWLLTAHGLTGERGSYLDFGEGGWCWLDGLRSVDKALLPSPYLWGTFTGSKIVGKIALHLVDGRSLHL